MKQPPAEQKETDYQAVREALSTVVASSEYTGERDMCTHSLAVLDRMEAERDQLRIDLAEVLEALRDELDCPDSATLRRAAAVLLKHDRRASGER